METYEMVCTCGEGMQVQASSEEEAIEKLKERMDKKAIRKHWSDMHPGEPWPNLEDMHLMIERELVFVPTSF